MDLNRDLGPIGSNVRVVFQSFRTLFTTENQGNAEDLSLFEDESTRFKMWVGNLGAHQSGRASLDYRLREALHLQQQVVYLLKDISDSLRDAVSLVRHEPPSWQKTHEGQSLQADMTTSSVEPLNDESSEDLSDFDENEPLDTSLSTQCADVGEAIDCLLRLSIAIANPAPHERFRKLGGGASEDVSYYETHDISYVQDKYPDIKPELAAMLGKTITRRRQFFKYREAHHERLAAGLDMASHGQEGDTSYTEVISKTVASSLPYHLKDIAEMEDIREVIDEDGQSDMGVSQTSYATSAGNLMGENEGDWLTKKAPPVLKVPPLPTVAVRGAFECPFCYRMVSASTRAAWKEHVFGDLRPYTCLLPGCIGSSMGFDRRHQWQLHVLQQHWQSWVCPFQCHETFDSQEAFKYHLSRQHLQTATEEHLSAILALGKKPASESLTKECPLCHHETMGLKTYIKHVGHHLEQLALFALPSGNNGDGDSEIASDPENVTQSEQDSEESDDNTFETPENIGTNIMTEDELADFHNLVAKVLKTDYEFSWDDSQRFFALHNKAVLSHSSEAIENASEEIFAAAAKLLQILQGIRSSTPSTNLDFSLSLVIPRQKDTEVAMTGEAGDNSRGVGKLTLPVTDLQRVSDQNQAVSRLLERYIMVRFPVSNPKICFSSGNLQYLVAADEGVFLFSSDLHQGRLVSQTIGGALENLQSSPPKFDGVDTLQADLSSRLYRANTIRNPRIADSDHHSSQNLETPEDTTTTQTTIRDRSREHDARHSRDLNAPEAESVYEEHKLFYPTTTNMFKTGISVPQVHSGHSSENPSSKPDIVEVTGEADRSVKAFETEALGVSFDDEEADVERVEAQGIDLLKRPGLGIPEHELTRESKLKDFEINIPQDLPIEFKDALGRKFSFPFRLCRSWQVMEALIRQAFAGIDKIGPHVMEGHYDIFGPDGEIILPSVWDRTIQPGWSIRMKMWPMEDKLPTAPEPPAVPLTNRGKGKLRKGDAQPETS